jgi:hypothetical protein
LAGALQTRASSEYFKGEGEDLCQKRHEIKVREQKLRELNEKRECLKRRNAKLQKMPPKEAFLLCCDPFSTNDVLTAPRSGAYSPLT